MERGKFDNHIAVNCSPYNSKEIWFQSASCRPDCVEHVEKTWGTIWPAFQSACEAMIADEDNPDWGTLEMLNQTWELHLQDPSAEEGELPDD